MLGELGVKPRATATKWTRSSKAPRRLAAARKFPSARTRVRRRASLREALRLGHNYIGTEHLLLGALGVLEINSEVASFLGLDVNEVSGTPVITLITSDEEPESSQSPAASDAIRLAGESAGVGPVTTGHLITAMLSDTASQATQPSQSSASRSTRCNDTWLRSPSRGNERRSSSADRRDEAWRDDDGDRRSGTRPRRPRGALARTAPHGTARCPWSRRETGARPRPGGQRPAPASEAARPNAAKVLVIRAQGSCESQPLSIGRRRRGRASSKDKLEHHEHLASSVSEDCCWLNRSSSSSERGKQGRLPVVDRH